MKYSLIAKAYLAELDIKEPIIKHTMVTWGDFQMMEDLFVLFGGDRVKLMEKPVMPDIIIVLNLLWINLTEKAKRKMQSLKKDKSVITAL